MKKVFLLLLLAVSTLASSQVFVTVEPLQFQPGLVVSNDDVYLRARYGNINKLGVDVDYYKLGAGIRFPVEYDVDMLIGINYNRFDVIKEESLYVDLNNVKEVSVEAGLILELTDRIKILALTDFINWETDMGIAYKF